MRINCEWAAAPQVRTPELAATWCRLKISTGSTVATLVRDRVAPHSLREWIDTSAYPLAEWFAVNWWTLATPSHTRHFPGLSLSNTGDGFAWPGIILRPDRGQIWASLEPISQDSQLVEFISEGRFAFDAEEVLREVSAFVEATVRRLEEAGISETLLQAEWEAIGAMDADQREFCLTAASWDFDPFALEQVEENALLALDGLLDDPHLLRELARATSMRDLPLASRWVSLADEASRRRNRQPALVRPDFPLTLTRYPLEPWREGFSRAAMLRESLGLLPTETVEIHELVAVTQVQSEAPKNVDALVRTEEDGTSVVIGPTHSRTRKRFVGARGLARQTTDSRLGTSLITAGTHFADRVERAFAAEFLAPAEGIRLALDGDYGDDAQERVAAQFGVSPLVISHQIENQLAA